MPIWAERSSQMTTSPVQKKVVTIRGELRRAFVDRGSASDGLLLGMLTGENVILVGPPGTAKSALARVLCSAITGARFFGTLVGKTTAPEDIFGPVDLGELKAGRYVRRVERYLPAAHVAHVDEVFRASSAILDATLTVINEHKFADDGGERDVPLRLLVGTSNSVPEDGELAAFYDRFSLRFYVGRVGRRADRARLVAMTGEPQISASITLDELDQAIAEVQHVKVPDAWLDRFLDVWESLGRAGFDLSERKARRVIKLARARAYLSGRDEVASDDLAILADVVWHTPEQRAEVLRVVLEAGSPLYAKALEASDVASKLVASLPGQSAKMIEITTAGARARQEIDRMLEDVKALEAKAPAEEAERIAEVLAAMGDARDSVVRSVEHAIRRG